MSNDRYRPPPVFRTDFHEAPSPCESCSFVSTCDQRASCSALKFHTETGRAVRPPRRPPGDVWRESHMPGELPRDK